MNLNKSKEKSCKSLNPGHPDSDKNIQIIKFLFNDRGNCNAVTYPLID